MAERSPGTHRRLTHRQLSLVDGTDVAATTTALSAAQDVSDRFDAARLTQARHLAGTTKKAIAERLGVSPAAVGQYEAGVSRPRPGLIEPLAEFLGVPMAFFLVGRPHARLGSQTAHFRSLRSMRSYQRDKAIAFVEQVWELSHQLERYVELPEVQLPGWTTTFEPARAPLAPAAAANELRDAWGLGRGPVGHLVRRLEANGVLVAHPAADPDSTTVDAFCTSELPRPVIVLTANRTDDVHRHRFTAAHELGHLVLHRDSPGTDHTREREADQFAAEFLTPRDSILPLLPKRLDLSKLATLSSTWGVSVHSLLYRCRETGLISDSAASRGYQRLHGLRDQPGFAPESVTGFPHEQPIMLRKAFELAPGLTTHELAARLGWSESHCRRMLGIETTEHVRPALNLLETVADSPAPEQG